MPSRADIKELNELRAEKSAHGAGDTSNGVSAVAVPVCESRGEQSPRDLSALAGLPAWQRRRIARLDEIFLAWDKQHSEGKAFLKLVRKTERSARKQFYRDGRKMRFSYGTLLRNYYHWRKHRRNIASLILGYKPGRKTAIGPAQIKRFAQLASGVGVTTFKRALQRVAKTSKCDPVTVHRRLPASVLVEIRKLHKSRRAARAAELRFRKFVLAL